MRELKKIYIVKQKIQIAILLLTFPVIAACSSVNTYKHQADFSKININESYQIRVRTGNIVLDRLLHESASYEFGKYLDISDKNPLTGYIDIVFASSSGRIFKRSTNAYTTNVFYNDDWYTGKNSFNAGYRPLSWGNEIPPGNIFSWQNSVMSVNIRNTEGHILWSARHDYRGGLELSGFYVKTADAAARSSLEKIIRRFEMDFQINTAVNRYTEPPKSPRIALVLRKKKPEEYRHLTILRKLKSLIKIGE